MVVNGNRASSRAAFEQCGEAVPMMPPSALRYRCCLPADLMRMYGKSWGNFAAPTWID
jgi:hypothetical protein